MEYKQQPSQQQVTRQDSLFASSPQCLDLPQADVRYYPHFIEDEGRYFKRLKSELQWHQDTLQMYGKPVLIPRLNAWYGDAGAAYSYSGLDLTPLPWTDTLSQLKSQLEQSLAADFGAVTFNSVLANLYRDGRDSVSWHSDDEPELGAQPLIASLSFGATRRFSLRLRGRKDRPTHIDLGAGSLLVMAGTTQRYWHHQLPKTNSAVAERINLTFRSIVGPSGGPA